MQNSRSGAGAASHSRPRPRVPSVADGDCQRLTRDSSHTLPRETPGTSAMLSVSTASRASWVGWFMANVSPAGPDLNTEGV